MFTAQERGTILAAHDASGAPVDDSSRLEQVAKPVRGTEEFIPQRHICRLAFKDDFSSLSELQVSQPREELDCSADVWSSSWLLQLVVPLDPYQCWPVALDGLEHRSSVRTRMPSLERQHLSRSCGRQAVFVKNMPYSAQPLPYQVDERRLLGLGHFMDMI